jgi:deoxyribodipyrimidine photolyase-related protein
MTTIRFVLGDQLSRTISSLRDIDRGQDVVLIAEVAEETTYVGHHKQKIVFFLSAMRHFAAELTAEGLAVDYVRLDAAENAGSLTGELARAVRRHGASRVVMTWPGEWRVLQDIRRWQAKVGVTVEIREDDRFLVGREAFAGWAGRQRNYRMEYFYREVRRKTGLLMADGRPVGRRWNFDADNRKRLPAREQPPDRGTAAADAVTAEVLALVERRFADHFGDAGPFGWAVDRAGALQALEDFAQRLLPRFGDYQDAMKTGAPFLYHSALSPYLNAGLLLPLEVCRRAEVEYREGRAPLNAVEGFVRQIAGWREYVRGVYWLLMPDYAARNALKAERSLPGFYWSGDTEMNCVAQVVADTRRNAYAHHIQRLMVTGNFALLAGVRPAEINAWYMAVYADAVEWVELPNTHGMAIFADGGVLGSKPYAASGAYIARMSDYCRACVYDVRQKTGRRACPFNYLYWAFLLRNELTLRRNPRLAMPYRTLSTWSTERQAEVAGDAERFLASLE